MNRALKTAKQLAMGPLGFWSGLTYPFRGIRLVYLREPGLSRIWLMPIVLTFASFVAATWAVVHYGGDLWAMFLPENLADPESIWETLWDGARTVLSFLLSAVLFLVSMVVVVVCAGIFAAPFNDALSEAVEHKLTNRDAPRFSVAKMARDLARTVRLELLKVLLYAAVMLPLMIGSWFLPGIGQVLAVAGFFFSAAYFAVDYVDWPAARRDWSVSDRVTFFKRHWPTMLGFGVGVWAMLFIPFVNLLFMPAAVAGGTMLFLRLQERT